MHLRQPVHFQHTLGPGMQHPDHLAKKLEARTKSGRNMDSWIFFQSINIPLPTDGVIWKTFWDLSQLKKEMESEDV